jgi:hypothetical protein
MYNELLRLSIKKTEQIDLSTILYNYISKKYNDDIYPEAYKDIINKTHKLRNNIIIFQKQYNNTDEGVMKNLLKQYNEYYYYIYKFLIIQSKDSIVINSKWYNSFNKSYCISTTLKQESLYILYNIACLNNNIGINCDINHKEAYAVFLKSSSIFKYLKNIIEKLTININSIDLNITVLDFCNKINHIYAIYVFLELGKMQGISQKSKTQLYCLLNDKFKIIHRIKNNTQLKTYLGNVKSAKIEFISVYLNINADFNYVQYIDDIKDINLKQEQLYRIENCKQNLKLLKNIKIPFKMPRKITNLINPGNIYKNKYKKMYNTLNTNCDLLFDNILKDNDEYYHMNIDIKYKPENLDYTDCIIVPIFKLEELLQTFENGVFDNIKNIYNNIKHKKDLETILKLIDNKKIYIKKLYTDLFDKINDNKSLCVLEDVLYDDSKLLNEILTIENIKNDLDKLNNFHNEYITTNERLYEIYDIQNRKIAPYKKLNITNIDIVDAKICDANKKLSTIKKHLGIAEKIDLQINFEFNEYFSKLKNLKTSKTRSITDENIEYLNDIKSKIEYLLQDIKKKMEQTLITMNVSKEKIVFEDKQTEYANIEKTINDNTNLYNKDIKNANNTIDDMINKIIDYFIDNKINVEKIVNIKKFISTINKKKYIYNINEKITKGLNFYYKIGIKIKNVENDMNYIITSIENIQKLQKKYIYHQFNNIE